MSRFTADSYFCRQHDLLKDSKFAFVTTCLHLEDLHVAFEDSRLVNIPITPKPSLFCTALLDWHFEGSTT